MATVVYSANALANLQRAFAFVAHSDAEAARDAADAVRSAVEMLAHHPMIGRIVRDDLRELVISFGRSGYLALYRFVPAKHEVRVLAIRHQRELDYP